MTCETSIELLPWLLNGTLEQQEKDQLVQHLAGCERCRTALAETRDAYRLFTTHVASEDLVAYVWDQPATVAAEVIERHLAGCAQCAAEAELAWMSRRLEKDANVVPFPVRKAAAKRSAFVWRTAALAASVLLVVSATGWWQSARTARSLVQEEEARPAASPVPTPEPTPSAEDSRLAELRAQLQEAELRTSDLAAEAAATAQVAARLEDEVERLRQPQVNAWSEYLEAGKVRSTSSTVEIPRDAVATPVLEAQGPESDRFPVVKDEAGKVLWQGAQPLVRENGRYSLSFPAAWFPKPGRYTLQLWSVENGERVPRESYTLTVR